jgi:hypothetical protein
MNAIKSYINIIEIYFVIRINNNLITDCKTLD